VTRSPLAYPLTRGADVDGGGAADLQTDVMRFLAILSLCLVAIFALVQSIPLTSVVPEPVPPAAQPAPVPAQPKPAPVKPAPEVARPAPRSKAAPEPVPVAAEPAPTAVTATPAPAAEAPVATPEEEGFTLRFASDAALMRAVAAGHVGVYAIQDGRAYRMTVSDSRISFWDASTPNTFHEMEPGTVPAAVVDALARTGAGADGVRWGVTLPGKLKSRLDTLMQEYRGGSLIIGPDGALYREES
jgi:hypothetical protein